MPHSRSTGSDARRAFHRELRSVARVLRLTGIAFALLGAAGLLFGYEVRPWVVWPSWVSLIIGAVLIGAGGVRRVRDGDNPSGRL